MLYMVWYLYNMLYITSPGRPDTPPMALLPFKLGDTTCTTKQYTVVHIQFHSVCYIQFITLVQTSSWPGEATVTGICQVPLCQCLVTYVASVEVWRQRGPVEVWRYVLSASEQFRYLEAWGYVLS
jgi:hypothetical protein